MLRDWLAWSIRNPRDYAVFDVVDVSENYAVRPETTAHVAGLLRDCLVDPDFLEDASQWLSWPQLEEWIRESEPRAMRLRRGAFGEVLASTMMEEFHGHLVPVRKLHYTITRGQSLPGTDVIAVTCDDHHAISGVCFIETKLRTTDAFASQAVSEAVTQLKNDHDEALPSMLKFVAERLRERRHPLFAGFMSYMRDRRDLSGLDSFRVFLVWEETAWTDSLLGDLAEQNVTLKPLTVHVAKIPALAVLIEDVYALVPAECEPVDD